VATCRLVAGSWQQRLLPVLAVTLSLAACGATAHSAAPPPTQIAKALSGSPAPLAALHAQANLLLRGGAAAFEARLTSLRGYPVVVNKWASWCGPCRSEFPEFQRVGPVFGRRVAFIGLDGRDSGGTAAAFLRSFPVTYPSYVDPGEAIARKLQAGIYYPQTVYFNGRGQQVYTHVGPYESAAALESDVRRYALGGA
jgi:cytochrome c biogenesis protein CcmG, thiol:disulfide interchange protein DsbE